MERTAANTRFRSWARADALTATAVIALTATVALALAAGAAGASIVVGGTSPPSGGSPQGPPPRTSGGTATGTGAKPTTTGGKPTRTGAKPTTTGAKPTTTGAKPTTTGGSRSTATGGRSTTTGGGPAQHRPAARSRRPSKPALAITAAQCVPASACSTRAHEVAARGTLQLQGRGLQAGQAVAFPHSWNARIARNSPSARLRATPTGLVVTVPAGAHSGHIAVLAGSRRSNLYGPIKVVAHPLHPPAPPAPPAAVVPPATASSVAGTPFAGQGMWIWYMSRSDGGSLPAIAAQAHAAGVTTLFVKSSDGSTNYWSQFSKGLVEEAHAQGLHVCAWQYVYGTNPVGEGELGARAAAEGADCLVIDAESQYEGLYGAAQTYLNTLRSRVGPAYPLGLASFPYVDYHPSFPYSVFLGPNGAQFNAPQMYWHDIGTSVAHVYVHTYEQNLIYGRPIVPLGQTYGGVGTTEIVDFRSLASAYGAGGESFWDWQETSGSGWSALAAGLDPTQHVPQPELTSPLLREGAKGDPVLWLQEHLASAYPAQPTTGIYEGQTAEDVRLFQGTHALPVSGETDAATWGAILTLPTVAVNWTAGGPKT